MSVTHATARKFAHYALIDAFGVSTEHGGRHLCGISRLETGYGEWWKGAGVGSNNMGAIQAGTGWTGETFVYQDTRPNPDGTSTTYTTKFRAYPTPAAGWLDLAHVAYGGLRRCVRIAAERGDTYSVSEYLHRTRYYEGFGATVEERRWHHFSLLRGYVWAADRSLGIETPDAIVSVPKTLRRGDFGQIVRQLQLELQITADGAFGPFTEAAVREYQAAHALAVDGVVGPATWTVLLTDDYEPGIAA